MADEVEIVEAEEVAANEVPVQTAAVMLDTTGVGFTVIVTVKGAPGQLPTVGVTV